MDLAELTLVVKSDQVVAATKALQSLTAAATAASGAKINLTAAVNANSTAVAKSTNANQDHENSFSGLISTASKLVATYIGLSAAMNAVQKAADFQRIETSFEVLLGSAEKAQKLINNVIDLSNKTPFDSTALLNSTRYLLNTGTAADEVAPKMKILANAVAAIGGDSQVINHIAYIFGEIGRSGTLLTRELQQLATAQINGWQLLADRIGVTIPQMRHLVQEGAISSKAALAILFDELEKKFGGLEDKIKNKLPTAFGQFKNQLEITTREVGLALADSFNVVGITQKLAVAIREWRPIITDGLREFFGLPPVFKQCTEESEKLATALRLVLGVFLAIIALKIAGEFLDIAFAVSSLTIQLVALGPVGWVVIGVLVAIASALAGLTLGTYLVDEFADWANAAAILEWALRNTWAGITHAFQFSVDMMHNMWDGLMMFIKSSIGETLIAVHSTIASSPIIGKALGVNSSQDLQSILTAGTDLVTQNSPQSLQAVMTARKVARDATYAAATSASYTALQQQQSAIATKFAGKGDESDFFAESRGFGKWAFDTILEKTDAGIKALISKLRENLPNVEDLYAKYMNPATATGKAVKSVLGGNSLVMAFGGVPSSRAYQEQADAYTEDIKKRITNTRDGIQKMIDSLHNDINGLDQGRVVKEQQAAFERAKDIAVKAEVPVQEPSALGKTEKEYQDELAMYKTYLDRQAELRQAVYDKEEAVVNHEIDKQLERQKVEQGIIPLYGEEKAAMEALIQVQQKAFETGVPISEARIKALQDEAKETYRLQLFWGNMTALAKETGSAISDALGGLLFHTMNVRQAVEGLAKALSQAVVQALLLKPLQESVTSGSFDFLKMLFGGAGSGPGTFGNGLGVYEAFGAVHGMNHTPIPFAKGGITNGPELFALGGSGRWGVRGEAGPEAVMPLTRTKDGRLGVHVGGGNNSTMVNVTINTPNADSFRKSEAQVTRVLARAAKRMS